MTATGAELILTPPPESLAAALAQLQAQLPDVRKGETAKVKSDKGSYTYTYANLADCSRAIMPKLANLGLSFSAKPTIIDGRFTLAYVLRHVSGESDAGDYPLPDPNRSTPQQVGSAITYARRYALCAITGLSPDDDDDDGKAAQDAHKKAEEREREEEQHRAEAQEYLADFVRRISEARTSVEIAALEADGKRRTQGGLITSEDAKALVKLLNERAAQLVGENTADDQTEIPV